MIMLTKATFRKFQKLAPPKGDKLELMEWFLFGPIVRSSFIRFATVAVIPYITVALVETLILLNLFGTINKPVIHILIVFSWFVFALPIRLLFILLLDFLESLMKNLMRGLKERVRVWYESLPEDSYDKKKKIDVGQDLDNIWPEGLSDLLEKQNNQRRH